MIPQTEVIQPIALRRYLLYHRKDGTFWIALALPKAEVPVWGVHASLAPIELTTGRERHALFLRYHSAQAGEVVLWDERVIDGVPVRWEIMLSEQEADLLIQSHFLTYGTIQAEVRFLYHLLAENQYTRLFPCPYPSVLWITSRARFSVVTLEPASPAEVTVSEHGDLVWRLACDDLNKQVLRLRLGVESAQEPQQALTHHIEYRGTLLPHSSPVVPSLKLRSAAQSAVSLLQRPDWRSHLAEDQLAFHPQPGDNRFSAFTAAAAKALMDWSRLSGDDPALWTARLAMNSVMEFQTINAQSPNSGACWDLVDSQKRGSDILGGRTLSLHRNARLMHYLLMLHRDTGSELCARAALNGTSWLLLKRGATGAYDGDLVSEDGKVLGRDGRGPIGAIIAVMCAAYGLTETEAYIHAANRLADLLSRQVCAPLQPGTVLPQRLFPHLRHDVCAASSAIEGLARLHRAYPRDSLRDDAVRLMQWLRIWQLQESGEVLAGEGIDTPFVDTSVESARGALWAFSLDRDARWFAYATRALHAASAHLDPLAGFPPGKLAYPDYTHALALFLRAYLHWLLSLPLFASGVECDPDLLVCHAGNRIFVSEPNLWRTVHVAARGLIDWVALVCPATHEVLLAVLTDGSSSAVHIEAGEHRQLATDLIAHKTGSTYLLHPVPGVGKVGVYILQA